MTDLIEQIEKAINGTAKTEFSPFFDRSSIDQNSSLRMAFKMGANLMLPLLKKAIEQRDFIYNCWHNDDIKNWCGTASEFKGEDNSELLKLLGENHD